MADPLRATAAGLAILAAAFAGWSGWSWVSAAQAAPPAYSGLRDQVLQAGEQAVENFNTLNYRSVGQGLKLWEQSSTGALHSEIVAGAAQFERELLTAGVPDPDLLIRTSGEQRISNFMLWQCAYAELVFVDTLWPDFGKEHLEQAIAEFRRRERRYGGVGD